MARSEAGGVIMFDFIFLGLLALFGASGIDPGAATHIQISVNQIFGSWPTVTAQQCTTNFFGLKLTCDGLTLFLLNLLATIGSALFRIGAFGALVSDIFNITGFSAQGVPLLPVIFVAFNFYLLRDFFKILWRSGSSD